MIPKILRALVGCALCGLASSCIIAIGDTDHASHWCWDEGNSIHGSGVEKTETRDVPEFTKLAISCGADVVAQVGPERTVRVTCDDNLLKYVRTEVKDGELRIDMKRGSYSFKRNLKVELTVPALEALDLSGSSDVKLTGIAGDKFAIAISGSGDVRGTGSVEHLEIAISGSGDVDLYGLTAQEVRVSISGSGDVEVTAQRKLQADVSGSGDVRYRGQLAELSVSGSGSGSVERD